MSQHYNAFISYKHAELDNKIAAQIEKDLEHYHIPRKLQKKTGYKRIERIFRDKDELPITSNLSGTIEEALLNSEYLIVLCSKSTCLSTWVEREIKLFLQNHPRENVLTVLAEGEPQDVIPRILQEVEVDRTKEDGTTETIRQSVEPLSCDYRIPRREIKSAEVPRMVAALIGCPYDELINRQRQFKMKRLTAFFAMFMAVAVGFGAYMIYSNEKIHDNYLESLRNQSRFLATESSRRLDNEERIEALQLAVAALPDENTPERPIVPEAVSALTNATYAYRTRATSSSIAATWSYTMQDTVYEYDVSPGKTTICARDASRNFRVWNLQTHEEIYHNETGDDNTEFFKYLNDDIILFAGNYSLKAVDTKTGKAVWEQNPFDGASVAGNSCAVFGDYLYVSSGMQGLYKISVKDGKTQEIYEVNYDDDSKKGFRSFSGMMLSPDGKKLVTIEHNNSGYAEYLAFFNLETRDFKRVNIADVVEDYDISFDDLSDISWADSESLLIAINDGANSNSKIANLNRLTKDCRYIYCINSKDMTIKWRYDFEYSGVVHKSMFELFDGGEKVAYGCANECRAWDFETGELIYDLDLNEPIIKVVASDKMGFICFTSTGGFVTTNPEAGNDAADIMFYFTDGLDTVVPKGGIFAHKQGSNTIICYESGVFDTDVSFIGDVVIEDKNNCAFMMDGDYVAALDKEKEALIVKLYDAADKKYIGGTTFSNENLSERDYAMCGIYDGKVYLTRNEEKVLSLVEVDCASDTSTTLLEEYCGSYLDEASFSNGKLVYASLDEEENKVIKMFDVQTRTSKVIANTDSSGFSTLKLKFHDESGLVFVNKNSEDVVIDLSRSETRELPHPENWEYTDKTVFDPENKIVIMTDNKIIQAFSVEGDELCNITCPDVKPVGFSIYAPVDLNEEKLLVVLYDNGQLFRYKLSSGEFIGKTSIAATTDYISPRNLKFFYDYDNKLMIISGGAKLYMVSLDNYLRLARINNCIGYHQSTDTFICDSLDENGDYRVGFFEHYSVEDLLAKAGKILEGIEVSEELKNAYGIK